MTTILLLSSSTVTLSVVNVSSDRSVAFGSSDRGFTSGRSDLGLTSGVFLIVVFRAIAVYAVLPKSLDSAIHEGVRNWLSSMRNRS